MWEDPGRMRVRSAWDTKGSGLDYNMKASLKRREIKAKLIS